MRERRSALGGVVMVVVAFLAGLGIALAIGWGVFPALLFSEEKQPLNYSHAIPDHQLGCDYCHYFREDGTYSGVPGVGVCMECHEMMITDSEDERILVEEFIQKDKEIPWKIYAWQPDNVFFSHAAHVGQDMECTACHRDVTQEDELPPYLTNRLTGYSKNTMKMVECEKCHAEQGASNACHVCHK